VDHAGNVCLCYSHNHAFRHSGDCCQTQRLSGQAPFPKEIAGSQNCDHGFLPLLGDNGVLDLANYECKKQNPRVLPACRQFGPSDNRKWLAPRLLSTEILWDRMRAFLCVSWQAFLPRISVEERSRFSSNCSKKDHSRLPHHPPPSTPLPSPGL